MVNDVDMPVGIINVSSGLQLLGAEMKYRNASNLYGSWTHNLEAFKQWQNQLMCLLIQKHIYFALFCHI